VVRNGDAYRRTVVFMMLRPRLASPVEAMVYR
jgi:hypothetical protein